MTGRVKPNRALVTGGANGLGKAFVAELAQIGCEVHVLDQDRQALDRLHHDVSGEITTYQIDLSHRDQMSDNITKLMRAGRFDLVVLNAGINATGRFENIPFDAHQKLLEVNLVSPMILLNGLMAQHGLNKNAGIVFVSSLSHAVGYPGAASYAASKDSIAIYAKSIRKTFAKHGLSVTCAFPGPIDTDHAQRHAPKGAQASKRMRPDEAAAKILKAAMAGKPVCYPGGVAKMSRLVGWIAPNLITGMMRKIIFEKLDHEVY